MVELTDDTIDEYITETINTLVPESLKENVGTEYNALVTAQKADAKAKFIDCVHIYFFGTCLLYNISEHSKIADITTVVATYKELYFTILSTINNYLYKKQYNAESKILKYIPASKKWLNQELNINTDGTEKIRILQAYNFDNTLPTHLYIPKLDKDIATTPKLLKTTGLMNPEIAKIINDGQFTNVLSFKLEDFSLKNQFIVRHRTNKFIAIKIDNSYTDNSYTNIAFYKRDNLNKYYLLCFKIDKDNYIFATALLLNAITHIDFQPGYLTSLETELKKTDRKERYIYTFGIFKSFVKSDATSFFGSVHRCALIFDTQSNSIYYIDSELNVNHELYKPSEVYNYYNSIDIAIRYSFAENNNLKDYKVYISNLRLQIYDMSLDQYIYQSAYQRIKAGKPQFDWTGGYCGTYILMFFVIMILNPEVPIEQIFSFFNRLSIDINRPVDKKTAGFASHTFLLLLVRSFAHQIETHMNSNDKTIKFDKLDVDAYVNDKKVKVDTVEFPLLEDSQPNYQNNPLNTPKLAAQMFHKNNINKLHNVYENTTDKPLIAKVKQYWYTPKVELNNIIKMRLFTIIGDMFKRIDKIQTKLTPEQLRWQIENYGPDDSIYFIKY